MPPAKKTIGFSELRVGLLVLVSIAVLIFLILNASGDINPFARKLHLRSQFADATGLREGSEVRLAGVRVGKVDNIKLLQPPSQPNAPRVEVRFSVDNKIKDLDAKELIRTDSKAVLASPGLLGNEMQINITPGTGAGLPVQEGQMLESTSGSSFNDLATSGNDLVGRLSKISDQANELITHVNQGRGTAGLLFNDEALYNNLNSAVRDTNELIREIQSGRGTAGRFVNDPEVYENVRGISAQLNSIAADLRAGRGTAGKFLTNDDLYNKVNQSVDRLNRSVDRIDNIVANVEQGRGTVGKLLTDEAIYNDARTAIARFNTTAERIDNVVATAQRGEGTVGKLLTDEQLYSNVNQLSSEGVKLIYDFRQNPKKYLTVKFQLF
ncbi:MAG: phospholipid/cholesterol/gamma-HCH transport system substrate-binding protein [Blastocatellia bacterium]|jgi:phospholipid/cholesterol/gamma-HCH transport system substrate-binding protein|nr:phospholipid/cholesterol/gamma-HCH transport system substrate-binding protein [Blastocatellia bacterium]